VGWISACATSSASNSQSGIDIAELEVVSRFKPQTKTFSTANADIQFAANNVPTKNDLWTFGEIDPTNMYRGQNDKFFKVMNIERDEDTRITISASEYIANVYSDSDTLISYTPVQYKDLISPMTAPPTPILDVRHLVVRTSDNSIRNDIEISSFTDTSGYPLNIKTETEYAGGVDSQIIESLA